MSKSAGRWVVLGLVAGLGLVLLQGCTPTSGKNRAALSQSKALAAQHKYTQAIAVCNDYLGKYGKSPFAAPVADAKAQYSQQADALCEQAGARARDFAREHKFDAAFKVIDDFSAQYPDLASRIAPKKIAYRALEGDFLDSTQDKARGLAQQGRYTDALRVIDAVMAQSPKYAKHFSSMKVAYSVLAK